MGEHTKKQSATKTSEQTQDLVTVHMITGIETV